MAEDPVSLETFTPIPGDRRPAPASAPTLSIPERAIRRARARANQGPSNPHAMVHARANRLRSAGQYRAPLSLAEQIGMASTLTALFFNLAAVIPCACQHFGGEHTRVRPRLTGSEPAGASAPVPPGCVLCGCEEYRAAPRRMSEAKHAATAYAICQDKLQLLQARPEKAATVETDVTRASGLALARRLLQL